MRAIAIAAAVAPNPPRSERASMEAPPNITVAVVGNTAVAKGRVDIAIVVGGNGGI